MLLGAAIPIAHADTYVACQSGQWNNPTTWSVLPTGYQRYVQYACFFFGSNGSVPGPSDNVVIDQAYTAAYLFHRRRGRGNASNLSVTVPDGYTAQALKVFMNSIFYGATDPGNNTLALSGTHATLKVGCTIFLTKSSQGTTLLQVGNGTVMSGVDPGQCGNGVVYKTGVAMCGTNTGSGAASKVTVASGSLDIDGTLRVVPGDDNSNVIDQSGGSGIIRLTGNMTAHDCTNNVYSPPPIQLTITPGTGSTFNYDGASNQAVEIGTSNICYHNLTISGSAVKTPTAVTASRHTSHCMPRSLFTITGNFLLASGAQWAGQTNSPSIALQGNFTNNGTFQSGSGTYTFDGNSTPQTLTGLTTFASAAVNNNYTFNGSGPTAVDLAASSTITITSTLTLTSGVISTGNSKVVMAPGATINRNSGHVYGYLEKHIAAGSSTRSTFEVGGPVNYDPAELDFSGVATAGNVTVRYVLGEQPDINSSRINPQADVNGYWQIANSGTIFQSYNVIFQFARSDIDSGAHWQQFIVGRYSGSAWTYPTVSSRTNVSAEAKDVTGFGDFAIGDGGALAGFVIAVSGTASTCYPTTVSVTAINESGGTLDGFTGTIVLSTSSGHGTWSLVAGSGALSNPTLGDGTAAYTYSQADHGQVTLGLADPHADNLSISVASNGILSTSGIVHFRNNAFVFMETNAPTAGVGHIIAGRPQSFRVEMLRRDPTTGSCGPAPGYDASGIKAWITRTPLDPGGAAPRLDGVALPNQPPATNNVRLQFSNGIAKVSIATTDVGQYSVNLLDNTSGYAKNSAGSPRSITGTSNVLTAQPYALAYGPITANGTPNPGATTPSGGVFTAAGRPFSITVTGVLWQTGDPADGSPPSGPVPLSSSTPTPSFAWTTVVSTGPTYYPTSGTEGTLAHNKLAASAYHAGSATDSGLIYSEVGSLNLEVTATNYLDSGANVTGTMPVVGRFIPDHFAWTINTPQFQTFCGANGAGFTYVGQLFKYSVRPVVKLTAENALGQTTKNYYNFTASGGTNWFRLTNASLPSTTYTDSNGDPLDTTGLKVNGANPIVTITGHGTATLTFTAGSGLDYKRGTTPIAPFTAQITLSQKITDLDGVMAQPNPVTFNDIAWSNGGSIRYGRLDIENAYGSELLPLHVPLKTQYYASSTEGFVTNSEDTCTSGLHANLSNFQGNLTSTSTTPSLSQPPAAGQFNFVLSAPGQGHTGEATITLSAPSWLQFDWKSTGTESNPSALANFGLYAGFGNQIYLHQIY